MKNKDKDKNRKLDLIIKIALIIIIIILLIHNCVLRKECEKCNDIDVIDIDCDGNQCEPAPKQIVSLSFVQDSFSIKKGDSLELIVIVNPIELSETELTWISSNEKIVKVDDNGIVTGVGLGKATITVMSPNGKMATCEINVVDKNVAVNSIKLKPSKVTMKTGSTTQITATVNPTNATNQSLVWESSDPSIATVNSKGVIKALKAGKVNIIAKTKDGKVIAISTITVEKAPKEIESLSFAQSKINIKTGDSLGLVVTVTPTELSSSQLTWKSSNTGIVTVDSKGVIKALKEGKVTITVTSSNGKKATCTVTVTNESIEVKEIELKPIDAEVKPGASTQVEAVIKPENATDRELVWTSSDPSIATVDSNGIVKGIKSGTVTITAKTKNGKVVAKTTITIKEAPTPTPIQIESLSLTQSNVSVKKGDTKELVVKVTPTELSSSKLTWKSSNTSIVTVDENGVITGVGIGTATITVTSSNGKKATCTVEVVTNTIPVESIELTPSNVTMNVGDKTQIVAIIEPNNATDQELIWTSSNTSVATVDSNGLVTGIGAGTTTITAKTKDGKVVATSTITIEIPATPTPTPTPAPEELNVYDDEKPPVTWNGSTNLNIFTNSANAKEGVIAPEFKDTYKFKVNNNTEYNMKYSIVFDEENDSHINLKYKLKKNDTYIFDHYVTSSELIVTDQLINSKGEDIYYLEWYWESNEHDTEIGSGPPATYRLQILVDAESVS